MQEKAYDYLVVGAGLFGSVFAHEANKKGKKCLIIDKRSHVGGNLYTKKIEDIDVHMYGAHIFHTSSLNVWNYVQRFATFNRFTNSPIAVYKNQSYNLPFNMNTFSKLWGCVRPLEAKEIIDKQKVVYYVENPKNLEEQAINLVGLEIYEKFIKGYTQKQWGKPCNELPAFIIKRIPVRFTYDNNYFNDLYQGIPEEGYTKMIENMLKNIKVLLNADYFDDREKYNSLADKVIFTGMIDQYYEYCYGELEYRSLDFKTEVLDLENFQGNAVANYTEIEVPYTRIIEHKHFTFGNQLKTVITKEYSKKWDQHSEPYYPINDDKNNELYKKYWTLAQKDEFVIFGGRLGFYKYLDMNTIIEEALNLVDTLIA